jgi:DNA repair exonuclease SbcCD ATPase subunit
MQMPQWLSVRQSEVKAEEAALARIQHHLEDLGQRSQLLAARIDALGVVSQQAHGTEIMAEAQYRERLREEWRELRARIEQAHDALRRQQERLTRSQRALEVAENWVAEEAREGRRVALRRQDQLLTDLAGWRTK